MILPDSSVVDPLTKTPDTVLRVRISRPLLDTGVLLSYILAIVPAIAIVVLLKSPLKAIPAFTKGIVAGLVVAPLLLTMTYFRSRQLAARIHRLAPQRPNASHEEVVQLLSTLLPRGAGKAVIHSFLDELAVRGLRGKATIMLTGLNDVDSRVSLNVPFEPVPLDEVDDNFEALTGASIRTGSLESPSKSEPASEGKSQIARRYRRQVIYFGLRFAFLIYLLNLLIQIAVSISERRVDASLILWVVLFGGLVVPIFGIGAHPIAWYLVPGGLVNRKAKWRAKVSQVHLFVRAQSVLAFRPHNKYLWTMMVGDGEEYGIGVLSRREVEILLAAWHCPYPTPPAEKLIDLQ